jgi:hypothetical protein
VLTDVKGTPEGIETQRATAYKLLDLLNVTKTTDSIIAVAVPNDTAKACARAKARSCDFVFVRELVIPVDSEDVVVSLDVKNQDDDEHRDGPKIEGSVCERTTKAPDWIRCRERDLSRFVDELLKHATTTHIKQRPP